MASNTVAKIKWPDEFILDNGTKCVHVQDTSNGKNTGKAVSEALQKVVDDAITSRTFPAFLTKHTEKYRIAAPGTLLLTSASQPRSSAPLAQVRL